ncbi:MAG: ParB/RepB/Spo0J family partition protein [Actinomyces sp.]|uniref:ParB/RepB/Spo0J family partition protein n=1 Tax=Actinomyces sp. TaxID=29317 RepID=UPI0026DD2554|nr:ParB/RepB/Spo0J family partition protein [Actinomyces sp.]MDO4242793.1 ParB/RepB/Spo0J family partition protein [Actinomyces sp.]
MAQKKRGLGRGLQALIPDAQVEAPVRRPSDVFFPEGAREEETEAEETSAPARRRSDDVAATLLAPSKRTRRPTRSGTRKKPEAAPAAEAADSGDGQDDVSRETPAPSAGGAASGSARRRTPARREAGRGQEERRETAPNSRPVDEPVEESVEDRAEVPVEQSEPEAAAVATGSTEAAEEAASAAQDPEEEPADETVELVPVPGATFAELPVDLITPNPQQPRQVFDEEDITELAASIREVGLLQPIVVRRADLDDDGGGEPHYELIMGERRLRAAKEAGMETIPAVVRSTADEDLLRDALLENLHRVQLNPLEEAAAYQQLLEDFNCTHAELSQKIARSRSQISNTLRLMKLPPLVQRRLAAGVLSAGHARSLLGLPDAAAMERLAQRIVAEGLSVRATEELVALHDEPAPARGAAVLRARSTPLPALSTRLSDAFDTRVKVTRGAKKGRITIEFAGEDDLARLIEALAPGTSLDED